MANKKDEPGKDNSRPQDAAAQKRPYATLDLKATEVKSTPAKSEEAKPAADAATPGNKPAEKADAKPGDKPAAASAGAGAGAGSGASTAAAASSGSVPSAGGSKPAGSSGSPGTSQSGGAKAGEPAGKSAGGQPGGGGSGAAKGPPPKSAKPEATPPPPQRSGGGIGGFFTHLAAGLFGGFLALIGGDALAPQIAPIGERLGLPTESLKVPERTAALEDRLRELEARLAQGQPAPAAADPQLAEKISAAEARLGELEALRQRVTELSEAQSGIAEKASALEAQLSTSGDALPQARLAKLEQQLQTLAAAGGNAENLPQLAAVTGRLADLETTLDNQITALRESVGRDIEQRIAQVAETSEAARSGTQRMDRQLANVGTEQARLGQRLEELKADTTRIDETLSAVKEETGGLRSTVNGLKSDVEARIAKLATPGDVEQAVTPIQEKIGSLEQSVDSVLKAEQDRQANAQRIVLSLELANLRRAIERGESYTGELAEVRKASAGLIDVGALETYERTGVSTLAQLEAGFRPIAHQVIEGAETPADGSVIDQLLAGARSVVRIRKVNHDPSDDSAEAIVARMEKSLGEGRLQDVLTEAEKLPAGAKQAAGSWLEKVRARAAVDSALQTVEDQLKASLAGGKPAAGQ